MNKEAEEWNPLLDALAYAYVRGWYEKESKNDAGKIGVAREQYEKLGVYAAAPELLEALKNFLDKVSPDGGISTSDAIDFAYKAIAKAEGK